MIAEWDTIQNSNQQCSVSPIMQFTLYLDWSPTFLTSDDFIRSNEIIRTKWRIYIAIGHFVLLIKSYHQNVRKAGDWPNCLLFFLLISIYLLVFLLCWSTMCLLYFNITNLWYIFQKTIFWWWLQKIVWIYRTWNWTVFWR